MSDSADKDRPAAGADSVSDAFAQAIGSSKLGHIDPNSDPNAKALLQSIGGVRGIIESVLPGVLFLVLYTVTKDLWLSVLVPLALSVVFVTVRVVSKGQSTLAFGGLIGVAISAVIALISGEAENNFLWGFIVNSVTLCVLVVSLLVRKPLIGFIVGGLTGTPYAWRTERAKRAVAYRATVLWVCVIGARLAVQVPLYAAAMTEALAATKLIMGLPLYAAALWITWLMVRAVSGPVSKDTPASKDAIEGNPT